MSTMAPTPCGNWASCHVAPPSVVEAATPAVVPRSIADAPLLPVTPATQQSALPGQERLITPTSCNPVAFVAAHVAPPSVELSTSIEEPSTSEKIARQFPVSAH